MVTIGPGKGILIKYLNITEADEMGNRLAFFTLNGQTRSVQLRDRKLKVDKMAHRKASGTQEIGAPLQGNLSKILVEEGEEIKVDTPLFIIEAM